MNGRGGRRSCGERLTRDGAGISARVDSGNGKAIARPNARAGILLVRAERSEQLHDLAIELQRDHALPALIEIGDRFRFLQQRTLERPRRDGGKTKKQPPDRLHQPALKSPGRGERDCEHDDGRQEIPQQSARRTKPKENAKDHPRRYPVVKNAGGAGFQMRVSLPVAASVSVGMRASVAMAEKRHHEKTEKAEEQAKQIKVHFVAGDHVAAITDKRSLFFSREKFKKILPGVVAE